MQERLAFRRQILTQRLEELIPKFMAAADIDLWVVTAREHNEDPVMYTMLPPPLMSARRMTTLMFHRRPDGTMSWMCLSRKNGGLDRVYRNVWLNQKNSNWSLDTILMPDRDADESSLTGDAETHFECMARVIRELNPRKIALNYSSRTAFADGLSYGLYKQIITHLGESLAARVVSAEDLCLAWLEVRLPTEIEFYRSLVLDTHKIIREGLSEAVIRPGITTNRDLEYWMMEEGERRGYRNWFNAIVSIRRPDVDIGKDAVIHRGDLIHCDLGLEMMGYHCDSQANAYVLRNGEKSVPDGLKQLHDKGVEAREIIEDNFRAGNTGDRILADILAGTRQAGIDAWVYIHPLGVHGHAAGPNIGRTDNQVSVSEMGNHPLRNETLHAVEYCVLGKIPEWGDRRIIMGLESEAAFTIDGLTHIDPQLEIYIIK